MVKGMIVEKFKQALGPEVKVFANQVGEVWEVHITYASSWARYEFQCGSDDDIMAFDLMATNDNMVPCRVDVPL
jgi:hypothetical protein